MVDSNSNVNPYKSPDEGISKNLSNETISSLPLGCFGVFVGAIAFAQLISCFGYYVGSFIYGFDRQPPVGPVLFGGAAGLLVGKYGSKAAFRIGNGQRPNLVLAIFVGLIDTAALLGTIDLEFEISFQSMTTRTAIVGLVCGCTAGTIISVLLNSDELQV